MLSLNLQRLFKDLRSSLTLSDSSVNDGFPLKIDSFGYTQTLMFLKVPKN